jgi:hypothetical protein
VLRGEKRMKNEEKPCCRLGDMEEERKRIVDEYARGNYLKTIADIAMEEERKKEIEENGNK